MQMSSVSQLIQVPGDRLGKPVARRAEVVCSGLKWGAPSICNVGSYQERHSVSMSGLHVYRYIHIYIYPWASSHANIPTHMFIFYTYMHMPEMGPFIFSSFWVRVGSRVRAVEGVDGQPVGGKLHESESDSVLELTSPLHRSRLAWKATLPGMRNWQPIEIDEIFKHFSINWTLAFGKISFNKRPAWPMQMCPRVSFFYGLYRSQGLQWRGQASVAKSLSGDQVLSGFFIAHLSRQLLFQPLAVSAG